MADFLSDDEEKQETVKVNSAQEFSTEFLKVYYSRLFPYDRMFNWLAYGNDAAADAGTPFEGAMDKDFFMRREWSFTIEDDIYIRYQCFSNLDEMTKAIQKRQPHKIDIGAVFTAHPKDHTTLDPAVFKTVERELVFDIDMTDYDVVRTCCKGASICGRCWPFMTMALKCVDTALREDFAFKNILWIYSGRRGIHCWVCDPSARALPNEARSAVVEYLSLELDGKDERLRNQVRSPLHPHLKRSFELLEPYFAEYIVGDEGQGIFTQEKGRSRMIKVLNSMPDKYEDVRLAVNKKWENDMLSGEERWEILKEMVDPTSGSGPKRKKGDYGDLVTWMYSLVFKYTYPRLDANVSKQQNHLLKSPFCVHPKTGRVCVPIDPKNADSFDPFKVPTVSSLCKEIDQWDAAHPDKASSTDDMLKTSMKDACSLFDKTFMEGMWKEIKSGFREKLEETSAMHVDF